MSHAMRDSRGYIANQRVYEILPAFGAVPKSVTGFGCTIIKRKEFRRVPAEGN